MIKTDTLNGCAAYKADGIEECAQIPDIEGGFLAIEPDIGEGALCAFLGRTGEQFLELRIWHAEMAVSGATGTHAETIPTSVGRVRLLHGLASTGLSAQLE